MSRAATTQGDIARKGRRFVSQGAPHPYAPPVSPVGPDERRAGGYSTMSSQEAECMAELPFLNAPFRGPRAVFPRTLALLSTWGFDPVGMAFIH